jgi:hypothetical protein
MRAKTALLAHEQAAHRGQMLALIGRLLRQEYEYDTAQPVPDRIADLVKKIEQSTSASQPERK